MSERDKSAAGEQSAEDRDGEMGQPRSFAAVPSEAEDRVRRFLVDCGDPDEVLPDFWTLVGKRDAWKARCEEAERVVGRLHEALVAAEERANEAEGLLDNERLYTAEARGALQVERAVAVRLREALQWYADPENYREPPGFLSHVAGDGGRKASAALVPLAAPPEEPSGKEASDDVHG